MYAELTPWFCAAERAPGEVVLSRYRIESKLGDGACGTTYKATDTKSGMPVAVKELALGRLKTWKQFELFKREADTLRQLSHPNIPDYLDYKEEGGCFFLVQELASGPTLQQWRSGGERIDDAEVCRISRELLLILKYLSSRRCGLVDQCRRSTRICC
jgi:serine/threonine protein kinase